MTTRLAIGRTSLRGRPRHCRLRRADELTAGALCRLDRAARVDDAERADDPARGDEGRAHDDRLGGVGYLLKDRVSQVAEFLDGLRRVAGGGTVLDPEVVSQLLVRRRRDDPLRNLTPREREVLGLMA